MGIKGIADRLRQSMRDREKMDEYAGRMAREGVQVTHIGPLPACRIGTIDTREKKGEAHVGKS